MTPSPLAPYHVSQVAALCREHPVRQKVVFAPSPQIGYNLSTALATRGTSWVNLLVTTPADYARTLVEPELRARGLRPLSPDAELLLLDSLLRRVLSSGGYFAGLAAGRGVARSFAHTLHALRLAGASVGSVESAALEKGKARPLARALAAYEGLLEERGWYDHAALFEAALERLRRGPVERDRAVYAILDETPVPGRAGAFVEALGADGLLRIGRAAYGLPAPAACAAARFADVPAPASDEDLAPGGRVLQEGLRPGEPAVRVREAIGAETELRGVLREILAEGIPLDHVEIAYTTESPYLSLLVDASERYDLEVAFAEGLPVTLTRPGQALLAFFRWIQGGCEAAALARMGRAGLITFNSVLPDGVPVEPHHAASRLLRGRAGTGTASCLAAVDRLVEAERARLEGAGERARSAAEAELATLGHVRQALAALCALAPSGTTSVQALAGASVRFLRDFAAARGERDARACDSLVDRLEELGREADLEASPAWTAQRLAELVASHKVEAAVARPGALYAVPLERAGYTARPHLYVLGLDEASFPGTVSEDPLLLDDERAALSGELALQRGRPGEQVWHLVRVLGSAAGPVTLLASRRGLSDGRERYPSAFFGQVAAQLGLEAVPRIDLVPSVERALDRDEARLAIRRRAGFSGRLAAECGALERGRLAAEARAGDRLTRFDGWLGEALPDLVPGRDGRVLSASRLETLARCPYRYFLRYVLGIEPPDEAEPNPSRWLTPLESGSLLHELFRVFMEELHDRGERPDAARHAARLDELLDEAIEEARGRIPEPNEAAFRGDVRRLRHAARVFLQAEDGRAHAEPAGFEVSFGYGRSDGLHEPEPVVIHLGDDLSLPLRGRIDRVDRVENGYEVWDYKTGSMGPYDEQDLLKHGAHLQWALYAHAFTGILERRGLPGQVRSSGYFFASDREHGRRAAQAPPTRDELARRLRPLFDMAGKGCFFHVQKEDQCTYCDYNGLCAGEARLPGSLTDLSPSADGEPPLEALVRWMET